MKTKSFKILCFGLFAVASFYVFKSWQVYSDKSTMDIGKVELSQVKLDLEEVKSTIKEPIWLVKTKNPVVAFRIRFKNEGERSFSPGLLDIVVSTLMEGAGNRDATALKKVLDDNSISMSISSSLDELTVDVSTVSSNFGLSIDILSDIISKAHLKAEKLEINKQGLMVSLQQNKFSTGTLADDAMKQIIYPGDHPYRITTDDLMKHIPTYTKEQCDGCYKSMFSADDAVITIAGNIDGKVVEEEFKKLFASVAAKKNDFKNAVQNTDLPHQEKPVHVELDNPQSTVLFSLPGLQRTSQERFALRIANLVFGSGGFSSKLFKHVRNQHGLVYGIFSQISDFDMHSHISGMAKTRPENVSLVIKDIKEECAKLYNDGITKEELEYFKTHKFSKNVIGSTNAALDFVDGCRFDYIKLENVNHALNNYYNLTVEDVNKVIKKVFDPKTLVFVSSGKSPIEKESKNENN